MAKKYHSTNQFCKRALALSLALATAIGSWSVDWNTLHVDAYASSFEVDAGEYQAGDTIQEYYTNEGESYQKLTGVSFYAGTVNDGSAIFSVTAYDGDTGAQLGNTQGGTVSAIGQVDVSGIDALIAPHASVNVVVTFTQVTATMFTTKADPNGSELKLTLDAATAPQTEVTITSCPTALAVGQTGQIVATDANYGRAITYTSSDPSVLTVDNDGVITAVATGTATITADTSNAADTEATRTVSVVAVDYTNTTLTYTGTTQIPEVTAKVGSTPLVKDQDYTVSGAAKDVGTYTVNVAGVGTYGGVASSREYKIEAADMSSVNVSAASFTIDTTTSEVTAVSGVKLGSVSLSYGTDFTATAVRTSGSLVGTNYVYKYKVTLTGAGNLTGTKEVVDVEATADAGITLADVYRIEVPEEADLYVGATREEIIAAIKVYDKNGNAVTNPGFTYEVSDITKPGNVTVKATYSNYYAGEISTTFVLYGNLRNNSKIAVTLSGANTSDGKWVYTGSSVEPGVTVTYDTSTTLVKGTDYTVTFSNNTNPGTATVTIAGRGNYTGSTTETFIIVPNLADATVKIGDSSVLASSTNNYASGYTTAYTGNEIKPTTVVRLNGSKLTNTEYSVVWSNNTDAGTATATIVTQGDSYGVQRLPVTFTIEPASISGGTMALTTTSYIYRGSAYTPTDATVTVGGNTLSADTDYELTYSNNTNAGTAFVTATGKGNYKDEKTVSFTITPKAMTSSNTVVTFADTSYTGSAITPKPSSVTVDGVELTYGVDYSENITYTNNKNKGTATGTITGIGNYSGTATGSFAIVSRAIIGSQITYTVAGSEVVSYENLSVTGNIANYLSSYTAVFNGYERKPSIKVMDGDATLVRNRDYSLTYANDIDAGNGATVTITGIGNYAGTGSINITYSITKCDLNDSRISVNTDTFTAGDNSTVVVKDSNRTTSTTRPGGALKLYDATSAADGDYTITWNGDTTTAGAGKTMTISGQNNYTGTREVTYDQGLDIHDEVNGEFNIIDKQLNTYTTAKVNGYDVVNITYMGETSTAEVKPKVVVAGYKDKAATGSSTLVEGTDYKVDYKEVSGNGYDAGSIVKVTVTGIGANHYGTWVKYYYITKATINTKDIVVKVDGETASVNAAGKYTKNYPYKDGDITPSLSLVFEPKDVTVKDVVTTLKSQPLTEGTDYTYTPPTISGSIGDKTGTIKGAGVNFDASSTAEILYTVNKADLADATIAAIPDQEYTAAEVKPEPVVTYNGATLTKDVDYTVTYANNTNAGVATVTVTGKDNYTGSQTANFNIVKKVLTKDKTEVALTSSSKKYTGSAITLTADDITVKYNGQPLTYGTDYTLTYENNSNPGRATVRLATGTNGVYGVPSAPAAGEADQRVDIGFDIYLDLADTTLYGVEGLDPTGVNELVYNGNDKWSYRGQNTEFSTDSVKIYTTDASHNRHDLPADGYAFVTSNLTQASNAATISINGAGANKFCVGTLRIDNVKVFIDANLLTWDGLAEVYAYNGNDIKPKPTVYYGNVELSEGSDFTYMYDHAASNFKDVFIDASTSNTRYFYLKGNGMFEGTTATDKRGTYSIKYDLSKATASGWENTKNYGVIDSSYRQVVNLQQTIGTGTIPIPSSCYTVAYTSSKGSGATFNNAGAVITAMVSPNNANPYSFNTKTLTYTIEGINVSDSLTIELDNTETYYYTGSEITPTIKSVKDGAKELNSTEYTVSYADNVNAGTGYVVVTGNGNYSGVTRKAFTINKKNITSDTVVPEFPTVTYTGDTVNKEQLKGMKLRDSATGTVLEEGKDFEISQPSGTYAGTGVGSVKVTVLSTQKNYEGNKIYNFDIEPLDLRNGTMTVDGNATEFTGNPVTPAITVTIDGVELPSSKYKVTYNGGNEMVDIGEYDMLIEPKSDDGNIIGSLHKTYSITGRYISTSDEDTSLRHDTTHNYTLTYTKGTTTYNYGATIGLDYDNGTAVTFDSIKLVDNDHSNYVLEEAKDYTIEYKNNKDAGTAILQIKGIGNYAGLVEQKYQIGKDMHLGSITLSNEVIGGLEYNGAAQKPAAVTIKDGDGVKLLENRAYTLSYSDDITNVGVKKVTATAIGTSGYYGTLEAEYRIVEKTISNNNLVKIVPKLRQTEAGVYYADYTGQEIKPEVDVYIDNNGNGVFTDGEKIAASDFNVAYSNNIEASDNALISVTLTGNYATKILTRTFTIRGCEFNEDTTTIVVNDRSYDYTGSEITPNITVYQDLVDGSRVELVKDQDYYIPAEGGLTDNVNPGDATVTIRGKGSFTGSRSATFVICADLSNAFDITGNTCNVPTQLYTGDRLTPMVEAVIGGKTLKSGDDFIVGTSVTFTAYDSDNNPTAGTVDITGNNKYYKNTYTASFEVTTDLSQIELSYSGLDNVIYSGQEQKQRGFKIYDPSGNEVSYAEDGVTYKSSSDGDACVNVGTVTVTIPITIGTIHSTVTTTYDIVKSNIASALYTGGANSTYTGNPLCPPVVLTYRGKELEVNKDYTIVYDNNTKPTSKTSTGATPAPATITITGIGNFYGTYNQEFQIYPERMREVAATPVGANGMIVSWDRLDHVSGYRVDVMKADSAVPVKTVDVNNGNATNTTIDGLAEGTTYSFRAYSYVTVEGTTYYGLLNSITTSTGISTPQISTASTVAKKATVSWRATNAGVKYIIYRSNTANGEYKLIAITKTDASSFTDVGLTRGSTYYYKIRAFRYPDEYGEYSDVSAVTVK